MEVDDMELALQTSYWEGSGVKWTEWDQTDMG